MFTKKQLSFLEQSDNYQVIRITDDYIEFRSRNTWHCWIIKKEPETFGLRYPYTIYHKHKTTDYYHRHWQSYSVEKCVESIADYDNYVMRVEPLISNMKKRRPVYE